MRRRIVVTGLGTLSPVGVDTRQSWESVLAGRSGVGPITRFDASAYTTRIAAEVLPFDLERSRMERKEARRADPFLVYANIAAAEALQDSGIDLERIDRRGFGVIIASGIGGIKTLEDQANVLAAKGPDRISPFFVPMMIGDMAAGDISIRYGLRGPNYSTVSACASAAHALLDAWNLLQLGYADIMLAGGTEAPITPLAVGGFCAMKALSTRNDEPQRASRPFDAGRDGFIMAEGAGLVVLETLEHARARGARIYAEFIGGGQTADAYHMTTPDPKGEGMADSMRMALRMSGAAPEEVGYINAHGTSTRYNDAVESLAIGEVFGPGAGELNISSTKSMTGHLLGASGAVEFIFLTLAVREGRIPPTINYEIPDPECTLNYTPNAPVERAFEVGLSNSFGFGGHNVTLAVRRFDETV